LRTPEITQDIRS